MKFDLLFCSKYRNSSNIKYDQDALYTFSVIIIYWCFSHLSYLIYYRQNNLFYYIYHMLNNILPPIFFKTIIYCYLLTFLFTLFHIKNTWLLTTSVSNANFEARFILWFSMQLWTSSLVLKIIVNYFIYNYLLL